MVVGCIFFYIFSQYVFRKGLKEKSDKIIINTHISGLISQ